MRRGSSLAGFLVVIEPHGGDWGDQLVLGHIGNGKDRARSYSAIAETLGGKWDRRKVELAVRRLRLDGWSIAGANRGIWLADFEDLNAQITSMEGRIKTMGVTLTNLRQTRDRMQRALYPFEQLVMHLDIPA